MNDYVSIMRECMIEAIKIILEKIADEEIKDACLYIHFDREFVSNYSTNFRISTKFPENISQDRFVTILIQNKFWNLVVDQYGFGVSLDFFNKEQHNIYIPFEAILVFSDPEKNFCIDVRNIDSALEYIYADENVQRTSMNLEEVIKQGITIVNV